MIQKISSTPSLLSSPCTKYTKKDAAKLALINVIATTCLAFMSFELAKEYQSINPSNRKIALLQLGIAAVSRLLIEANIAVLKKGENSQYFLEKLMNILTRFSFEGYEILYNASINFGVSSVLIQQIFSAAIQGWIGFITMGDLINLLKKLQEMAADTVPSADQEIINHLLEPDFRNTKAQLIYYILSGVFGVSAVTVAEIYENQLGGFSTLLKCLGSFVATSGLGFFGTKLFFEKWEKWEKERPRDHSNVPLMEPTTDYAPPLWLKFFRSLGVVTQGIGTELLCVLGSFARPEVIFGIEGALIGSTTFQAQQEFQLQTKEGLDEVRAVSYEPNSQVKRTAVKVNQAITVAFFALFYSWFLFGFLVSPKNVKLELGTLMLATAFFAIIGRVFDNLFEPGRNSRSFNQVHFRLLSNPFAMMAAYEMLTQVVQIDSRTIEGSSRVNNSIRILAVALLGACYGTNQIRPFEEVPLSPSIARAVFFAELLDIFFRP